MDLTKLVKFFSVEVKSFASNPHFFFAMETMETFRAEDGLGNALNFYIFLPRQTFFDGPHCFIQSPLTP